MIIDTEVHVLYRARWYQNNPDRKTLTRHYTWHEHDADLLVAEMDQAGVDRAFLISYDSEDTSWSLGLEGYSEEDFIGGRKYTLRNARRHPGRFYWFNAIKRPGRHDAVALAEQDFDEGASGLKLFPAFIGVALDDPGLLEIYSLCCELERPVLISFEKLRPPRTLDLATYLRQMSAVLEMFPTLRVGLLHGGCSDPLDTACPNLQAILDLVKNSQSVYLSTAKVGDLWEDGTEYPYRKYLRRVEALANAVGSDRVMWATDWPWYEWAFKYKQGVDCIRLHANLSSDDKEALLGRAAVELLGGAEPL